MERAIKGELLDESRSFQSQIDISTITQQAVDDDIYEDTGDLEFELSSHSVYLSRLPKFLWKAWAQMKDGEELSLGTMRVESESGRVQRARLSFHDYGMSC